MIGASEVGSVVPLVKEGQHVNKVSGAHMLSAVYANTLRMNLLLHQPYCHCLSSGWHSRVLASLCAAVVCRSLAGPAGVHGMHAIISCACTHRRPSRPLLNVSMHWRRDVEQGPGRRPVRSCVLYFSTLASPIHLHLDSLSQTGKRPWHCTTASECKALGSMSVVKCLAQFSMRMTVAPSFLAAVCLALQGDEVAVFAYGGSIMVTLFGARAIKFDDDLEQYSRQGCETLVTFASSLGRATGHPHAHAPAGQS